MTTPLPEAIALKGAPVQSDRPWHTLACVVVGVFMVILDTTAVNVAFPTLQREFGATITSAQWIVSLYVLVLGVTTPLAGYLAERYGLKRMYLLGLGLFVLGSTLCGIAPSLEALIIARAVQGVGGGITQPSGMALLYRAFPPNRIGRAFGIFGLALLVGPALGPVLGGWLVDLGHWRWIFFINLPFGVAGIIVGRHWLHEWRPERRPAFDLLGVILSTVGFGALLVGAAEARQLSLFAAQVSISFAIGIVALISLWVHSRRIEEPLLELRLLDNPVFLIANVVGYIGVVALFAAQFLLPLYLEQIRSLSPGQVGWILLSQPLAAAFASPLAGRLYDRIGPRPIAATGFLLLVLSTWGLVQLTPTTPVGWIKFLLVIRGLAFGFTIQTTFTTALATVSRDRVARASALVSATRFSIQAIAVAVLGSIVAGTTAGGVPLMRDFAAAYGVTLIFALLALMFAFALPGWPKPWGGRVGLGPEQVSGER